MIGFVGLNGIPRLLYQCFWLLAKNRWVKSGLYSGVNK